MSSKRNLATNKNTCETQKEEYNEVSSQTCLCDIKFNINAKVISMFITCLDLAFVLKLPF